MLPDEKIHKIILNAVYPYNMVEELSVGKKIFLADNSEILLFAIS